MSLLVTITNSGERMTGIRAVCSLQSGLATLHFNFHDVNAQVTEEDGERLSGTFVSSRDRGTYEATLQRKRRKIADGLDQVQYRGKWRNTQGHSGEFSIEWDRRGARACELQQVAMREQQSHGLASAIVSFGTREEPVFLAADRGLFNDRGRTVAKMFLESLKRKQIARPDPIGDQTWRSWKHGDRVRVPALEPMADRILAEFLRVKHRDSKHVMTPDRGYECKDVNVYSRGGNIGKHQDAQPYGSLVFVFCAGLACQSSVWLKSGERKDLEMRSGDCMIFEGKTWHQVHNCIPNTSPFEAHEWLGDRRLSILIRQRPR